MNKNPSFFKKYCIFIMAALLICLSIYNSYRTRFVVDDAYITMRYSRHLAEGRGPVYNLSEKVEGYTNFLWMVILSAAYKIGLDMPHTSQYLGILLNILTMLLLFMLMYKSSRENKWMALFPLILLANNRTFTLWATGGLETSLFTFLLTLTIVLSYQELKNKTSIKPWLGITCFLLSLTRPEGIMVSFLVFILLLFFKYRHDSALLKKSLISWTVSFGLPLFIYLLWKLSFYHDLLPNTFYNKINGIHYFSRGWKYFSSFVLESWTFLWILPVFFVFFVKKISKWIQIPLVVLSVFVFYTIWVGGDWMGYRFYSPLLPLLAILFSWSSVEIIKWISYYWTFREKFTRISFVSIFMFSSLFLSSIRTYLPEKPHIFKELGTRSIMNTPRERAEEIGEAFQILLKPDEVIAHSFAGFPSVYTDNRFIDILGQTDSIIGKKKISERHTPGHEKGPPSGYLEENQTIFIYPWVVDTLNFDQNIYSIKYKEGKYLKFNSTWSQEELAKRFSGEGFDIYFEGVYLNPVYTSKTQPAELNFDFETGNYMDWTVSGSAFGEKPANLGKWHNSDRVENTQGHFFVNTFFNNNDADTGEMMSKPFKITGDYIRFLIGGGNHPGKTCINLIIEGQPIFTATGKDSERLEYQTWDVRSYSGKNANIQIVDNWTEGWGHILIDDIRQIKQNNE